MNTSANDIAPAAPVAAGSVSDDQQPRLRKGSRRLMELLEAYVLVLLLFAVIIFFSLYPPTAATFASAANLQVTLGSQAVVAIVALGSLIPLICNQWDLSIGASAGLSSVFVASAFAAGASIPEAVALGIGLGLAVGVVNSGLVIRGKVNAIIATLGVSTVIAGVINQKTDGRPVNSNIPDSVTQLGTQVWLGIPVVVYVLALIAILVYYMLEHTPFGRQIYAIGSNPEAARLVGLRTNLLIGAAFILAGVICGLAGILLVARAGGADPRSGDLLLLPALAAAFLSAASIKPGRYNVGGVLVAIAFLASINSGLNVAGVPPYVNSYVNGGALIIGVGLASLMTRKRAGNRE